MRWDEFMEPVDAPRPAASAGPLPVLPESQSGKPHVGEVVKVFMVKKDFDWAKHVELNPHGKCIVLEVAVGNYKPVEATIPCHYTAKVAAMCRSARVHPPERGEDWDEQQLLGKTVIIETVTAVSARGTEYAKVTRWIANAEPLPKEVAARPAAKPVARSQAAKAHQAFTANAEADDIPF